MTSSNYSCPAVVIDAEKLSQIAIIQDLGRRGIPVVAIASTPSALGLRSRYARRRIVTAVPSHDDEYTAFLLAEAPRGVLFASNDANAEMIARNSAALSEGGFSFLSSGPEVLEKLVHKERLTVTAAECGVKAPRSRLVSAADAVREAEGLAFPCILKSTNLAGGVYEPVPQPDALDQAVRRMQAAVSADEWRHRRAELMVQEWIPQQDTTLWNFNALAQNGEIVSYSMGIRVRSDIRRNGAIGSMLLHGRTAFHAGVLEANRRLVRHVGFSGIMETEWSQSAADPSALYLYDFNPRPSGNFRWTLKSGVPMALQYYQLSLGRPATGSRSMQNGVSYFKIVTKNNEFLWALRNPRLTARGRIRVLAEDLGALLRPGRHAIDILDVTDPRPSLGAARELASYCWTEMRGVSTRRFQGWMRSRIGRAEA